MYEKKGTTYAAPGKLLRRIGDGLVCFQHAGAPAEYEEIDAPTDDMEVRGGRAFWAGGLCTQQLKDGAGKGWYKQRLVKRRYSNDDQLAVMLNREASEEGELEYQRMQEWRQWAGDVAEKLAGLNK